MSVKFLYYTEDTSTGGALSTATLVPYLDQMCAMYGGELMCVHPANADYTAPTTDKYATLLLAQAAYPDHTWIYLTHTSETMLDELTSHPTDNVVYVVGHDITGYGDETLNGNAYKLRTLRSDTWQGHAVVILGCVMSDRWHGVRSWL